jgi:hypothetical protein
MVSYREDSITHNSIKNELMKGLQYCHTSATRIAPDFFGSDNLQTGEVAAVAVFLGTPYTAIRPAGADFLLRGRF